jgi:hypothetical protein
MSSSAPKPRTGARAAIEEFFERNPHEQLTYEDIRVKFNLAERQAYRAVEDLRKSKKVSTMTVVVKFLPDEAAS